MPARGRPPLQTDEAILDAALAAFATRGFDGTSVRGLNAELGLSHETISQRFGSKPELFRAAIRHGIARFVAEFDSEVAAASPTDDLERLRAVVHAFMVAASHHPSLGELLHQGGLREADRTELASAVGLDTRFLETAALLRRLGATGTIRTTSMRELWFIAQAGAAPLHFRDLSAMFDPFDGPLDESTHLDQMVDTVMRSLRP